MSAAAILQFYELSTPTVGEEVKEEMSERKNGVEGGNSVNIPKASQSCSQERALQRSRPWYIYFLQVYMLQIEVEQN